MRTGHGLAQPGEVVAQLFPDESLAGAALEEVLPSLGVGGLEVRLVVYELERATVPGGPNPSSSVAHESRRKVSGVAVYNSPSFALRRT